MDFLAEVSNTHVLYSYVAHHGSGSLDSELKSSSGEVLIGSHRLSQDSKLANVVLSDVPVK